MRTRSPSFTMFSALLITGCATDPASPDEDLDGNDQNGIIFDDFAPSESCDLNIPLRCPSRINFGMAAPISYVTGATEARNVNSTAVAAIRSDGQVIQCQPSSDTLIPDILSQTVFTSESNVKLGSGAKSLTFVDPVNLLHFSPPNPAGYGGVAACQLVCDDTVQTQSGCDKYWKTSFDDVSVNIDGQTKKIDMAGQVESYPFAPNGFMTLTCKGTLPASQLGIQVFKRPNDVIAVDRGRFVRGYEFTGNALREACAGLANKLCSTVPPQNIGGCITQERDKCVADFSQPDPCVRGPVEDPH